MYLIPGSTGLPRITFRAIISKSTLNKQWNRAEIQKKYNVKKFTILNHFGVYKLSIYKNSYKNDYKKSDFL